MAASDAPQRAAWRDRLYIIIFEADTRLGRLFDLGLLASILVSVAVIMLDSVDSVAARYGFWLSAIEWYITIAFTVEYVLRLLCVRQPLRYATSFYGVIDLLAILPTYISVLFPGSESMAVVRALRLLRVFRVLKLTRFLGQANMLVRALRSSAHKITVFLGTVFILVVILGTSMYLIEGDDGGFDNIPDSIYWAVVTITTVGYGDLTPSTPLGKALAALVMILGYSIIAVPTGIVTAQIMEAAREVSTRVCPACLSTGHTHDARFCKDCGEQMPLPPGPEA